MWSNIHHSTSFELKGDGFVALEMWDGYHGDQVEESETFAAYFDKFVLEYGHGP